MPELSLEGVSLSFPFEPYACQVDFMQRVIMALQTVFSLLLIIEKMLIEKETKCLVGIAHRNRQNIVSAYLNSRMNRQQAFKAARQLTMRLSHHELQADFGQQRHNLFEQLSRSVSSNPQHEEFLGEVPKIYYASRTHSQLSQVIHELQNTTYKDVNICVLGSREQMCIEPSVVALSSNAARTSVCRNLVSKKQCRFHQNVANMKHNSNYRSMDIEDLVKFGTAHSVCPYYLSRETQASADIIFLPYNYIIDPASRASQNIKVKNAVILVDEAHNLESSCNEATSFEIAPTDLAIAIEEIEQCRSIIGNSFDEDRITSDELDILKILILKLEAKINEISLPASGELIWPGAKIFELFESIGLNFDNGGQLVKMTERVASAILQESGRSRRTVKSAMSTLSTAFRTVFTSNSEDDLKSFSKNYKIYIHQEQKPASKAGASWNIPASSGRSLSFWCFSSGVAMKSLIQQGVRSVILTSGTLSPLDSFTTEMQIPFKYTLENPHVISSNQLFVGVIPKGPSGHALNSSFKNRDESYYRVDLGNAIVNFCRIVPDGILVFFPSYGMMEQCVQAWKSPSSGSMSTWERIKQLKSPYVEPKDKTDFGKAIDEFYEKVKDSKLTGAIFFAVCRGKASEGIDFSDTRGRAVVITGIPYPAFKDPRVMLKRKFLDDLFAESKRNNDIIAPLSGDVWYVQQAARAVNQAIGRVIRHRNDWGAVLLCDDRFLSSQSISQLPLWVRPFVTKYRDFGDAQTALTSFMREKKLTAPPPKIETVPNEQPSTAGISLRPGHKEIMNHELFKGMGLVAPTKNLGEIQYEPIIQTTRGQSSITKPKTLLETLSSGSERRGFPSTVETFSHQTSEMILGLKQSSTLASSSTYKQPSETSNPKDSKEAKVAKVREEAKSYQTEVKSLLSKDEYREFQKVVKALQAEEISVDQVVFRLKAIFSKAETAQLLFKFRKFIPKAKKKEFEDFLESERRAKPTTPDDVPRDATMIDEEGDEVIDLAPRDPNPNSDVLNQKKRLCQICRKDMQKPFEAKCKHAGCHECWILWLSNRPECPVCKYPVRVKQLKKIYFQ